MKQYTVNGKLTLVGKAWEIRHQLKLMAKSSSKGRTLAGKSGRTLGDYLRSSAD
ncbi:Z-ring formation inhibitor MciZ [Paenibacillus montanisoli]|uniref:Z-ring formation inhibitor MciZ n=1 Tax=Paenibacillus montanisoli TaxID=2081970 RepID=A0A328U1F0_9BACL|nr:Z-ring formation inhibitor MciZ [Paenibacillus montanisoli]RAP76459.1 hypothetical protein DL346_13820 [Paenibacillus montanisoli]